MHTDDAPLVTHCPPDDQAPTNMTSAAAPTSVDNLVPEGGANGDQSVRSNAPSVVAFDKSVDDTLKLQSHDLKLDGENLIVVGESS